MATRDIVTLNEIDSRLEVPQVGDTYNLPRDVTALTVSVDKLNVGVNTASATGRIKADAIEFADGTVALTGTVVTGSQNIDSVLGLGNTTAKEMVAGRFGVAATDYALPIPAANIVDHDFFDNTQDAAWIDQCADKSWELEPRATGKQYLAANYANDAAALAANPSIVNGDVYYTGSVFNEYGVGVTTRASSRKFPMRGVATAEAARVIIWDITSGQPEMWMVFNVGAGILKGGYTRDSVRMSGNILALGVSAAGNVEGITLVDFTADAAITYTANASYYTTYDNRNGYWRHGLGNRNSTTLVNAGVPPIVITNTQVNSVAITYLPDAPLDDYGMRVPTIAVGTAGGPSRIDNDGTVKSISNTGTYANIYSVAFVGNYIVATGQDGVPSYTRHLYLFDVAFPTASAGTSYASVAYAYATDLQGSIQPYFPNHSTNPLFSVVSTSKYLLLRTNTDGVNILAHNPTTPANGMVAYLTNAYNTGWMVGDIRRAFLCNSLTADRSVKGGTLTMTGTVTETVNAGGVNVYSGFSATNYLSEASHADWNALGTGDFSIVMSGVKWGTGGSTRAIVGFYTAGTGLGTMVLYLSTGNQFLFNTHDGTTWGTRLTTADTFTDSGSHTVELSRTNGVVYIKVDGVEKGSLAYATSISTTGEFNIGYADHGNPFTGSIAQVRISATAPTPEQIKHMYETERKLFEPNAQALLSNSASVTDLRYDKKSGMYAVENGTNTDLFKDLVRVDSAATSATIATPVTTLSGNRVLAPAVDIGSELSIIKTVHNRRRVLLDFNVVINGKFSTASGWTFIGNASIVNNALVFTSGVYSQAASNVVLPQATYKYTVTISAYSAGGVILHIGAPNIGLPLSNGTVSGNLTGSGSLYLDTGSAAQTIDNFFIRESTDTLPPGFKPTKVWAGGMLQAEGTDYDVTFDGFLYGISFFLEPATNVQVEGEYI